MRKIIRNEPVLERKGDKIPKLTTANFEHLPSLVKARLEIEKYAAAFCPVGEQDAKIKWTSSHKKALRLMLMESDSPFSSSLRAFSASIMGHLDIMDSINELTKICLDDSEDLRTRINATHSLLKFAEKGRIKDVEQILQSQTSGIRFIALKHMLSSKNKDLATLGFQYLSREKNSEMIKILNKNYETVSMKYSTQKKKSNK